MAENLIFRVVEELLWLVGYASGFFRTRSYSMKWYSYSEMVLVLEKNRWDLGASSTSRSTSTALLSTRNPDSLPTKLPEEPSSGSST